MTQEVDKALGTSGAPASHVPLPCAAKSCLPRPPAIAMLPTRHHLLPSPGAAALAPLPACPPACPPAEEPWELQGLILRSTLLHLLRSRRGFVDRQASSTLLARQQQAQQQEQLPRSGSSGGGGARGPGRAVLSNGSVEYAAAAATQQLE